MSKRNRVKGRNKPYAHLTQSEAVDLWDEKSYPIALGTLFPQGGAPAVGTDMRSGRCYELAGQANRHEPASSLVHGTLHGPDEDNILMGHAWVILPNGHCWEPLTMKAGPRELFDAAMNPVYERIYSRTDAQRNLDESGVWGAWHDSAGFTYDPDNPDPKRKEPRVRHTMTYAMNVEAGGRRRG